MRLTVSRNGTRVTEIECEGQPLYLGAGESCAVRLEDLPEECALVAADENNAWVLERLDDDQAPELNGTPVVSKVELKDGDEVRIGNYRIRVAIDGPPAPQQNDVAQRRAKTSVASMTQFVKFQLPEGAVTKRTDEPLTITAAHVNRMGKLNLALSNCELAEQLMDVALSALLDSFGAARAWIGVRRLNYGKMEFVEGRTALGHTAELPELGESLRPRVLDRTQFVLIPRLSRRERISVLTGPLVGPEATLGMVYIDSGDHERVFTLEDLDYFVAMMNLLATQLAAIFEQLAKARAAMMQGEVSVAHAIQLRLTPNKLPQWQNLQFGVFREPGREHTGDLYDLVKLSNQWAAFLVAHTSATGPMPSMLIAETRAAFRLACMHMDAPHVILRSLNHILYDGQQDHPLNLCCCVVDPERGEVRYSLAGELGAYIIGLRGEERELRADASLPPLGTQRKVDYPLLTEQLEPSESLVLYTPGGTTAKNRHGDVFGEDRFLDLLCDGFGQQASVMLREMLSDLRSHTEGGTQPDDITVLLAHRL